MDDEKKNQYIKSVSEYLAERNWFDLTMEEIELVEDSRKRWELKQLINHYYYILNFFLIRMKSKFEFSLPEKKMSMRQMLLEAMQYFYNKGYTKEETVQLICDKDQTKKY